MRTTQYTQFKHRLNNPIIKKKPTEEDIEQVGSPSRHDKSIEEVYESESGQNIQPKPKSNLNNSNSNSNLRMESNEKHEFASLFQNL